MGLGVLFPSGLQGSYLGKEEVKWLITHGLSFQPTEKRMRRGYQPKRKVLRKVPDKKMRAWQSQKLGGSLVWLDKV